MQGDLRGEELLDFIDRFVPGFRSRILGCSREVIERLEHLSADLSGAPLPGFYRWFLEMMGERMDVLMPKGSHVDYSGRAVISAYAQGSVRRVPGYLLVGFCDLVVDEPPSHVHLDLRRLSNEDAPVVDFDALTDHHEPAEELYPSFRESLAHQAFKYEHVMRFPHLLEGGLYAVDEAAPLEALRAFDQAMRSMGFERSALTGVHCPMYTRKGGAISCWRRSGIELEAQYAAKLGFDDAREARQVLEVLEDSIQWGFVRTNHIAR